METQIEYFYFLSLSTKTILFFWP